MFDFLKKPTFPQSDLQRWAKSGLVSKNVEPEVLDVSSEYPAIVQQIHHEFFSAGDKLLQDSIAILAECNRVDKSRGNLLSALGFINTPEAKNIQNITTAAEKSKHDANLVNYFQNQYPLHKFITEDIVAAICEKYNLVCGDVSLYKGFVPAKCLQEINAFEIKDKDKSVTGVYWGSNIRKHSFTVALNKWKKVKKQGTTQDWCFTNDIGIDNVKNYFENVKPTGFKICAPLKDMNTEGMTISKHQIFQHIPDPVVLQPVEDGYLIITAWGDEASDPLVVNHQNN